METHDIGAKIKALRLENGLTQEELANRCELTKGFISQIERHLTSPSIATLIDILEVLGTTLGEFFSEEPDDVAVFTPQDFYEKTDEQLKHTIRWIVPNAQKYEMEPIIIVIEPGGASMADQSHAGEEFGYVLEGEVVVKVGKKRCTVKAGDTFYYMSNKPHVLENPTKKKAVVLWVSTPPMF
ncbi:MAG: cupin domain-containing protein [Acholeplasmatales bacterium]|nr:MAG: cupin domain-containing protein [Acholeplasmatales bacterium]